MNNIISLSNKYNNQDSINNDQIVSIAIKNLLNLKQIFFNSKCNHFKNCKIYNFPFNKNLFNNFLDKKNKDMIILLQ